jgi:hypothetical protein
MFALALHVRVKYPVFIVSLAESSFDEALDIAIQVVLFKEAQATAAKAIVTAWQGGISTGSSSLTRRLRQSRKKCPCGREINRQLFGPYSGCVTCSVK